MIHLSLSGLPRQFSVWKWLKSPSSGPGLLLLLLAIVVSVMSVVEPRFYGVNNLFNILRNASLLALVACGQALVLITAGFDLSVGAVVALSSVITAKTMGWVALAFPDHPDVAVIVGASAGIGCGAIVGLANGLCVVKLRISGFIVTLGTMSVTLGIALMITNGIPIYGLPDGFVKEFGRAQWLGLPTAVYAAAIVVSLGVLVQRRTILGRYIYAIGGNLQAARVSGVATQTYEVSAYIISGILAALTGVLLTAQVGSGQASFGGDQMMLQSIAAAVIGGVSLRGGAGRIEIVALSALFLAILTNSLNILRIDSRLQPVFLGIIMVLAVALDEANRRRKPHDQ